MACKRMDELAAMPPCSCRLSTGAVLMFSLYIHLNQNSQAVKIECGPQKGQGEKRCEIQGGGQEMAVMVG